MHVYAVVSDQMIGRRVRVNVPATLLSAGRGRKEGIHALLGKERRSYSTSERVAPLSMMESTWSSCALLASRRPDPKAEDKARPAAVLSLGDLLRGRLR